MSKKYGKVALAGRPNSGKSSFMNHVIGQKLSIVSDKPQTTRDLILGVGIWQETQFSFLDLPGIHKPSHKLNNRMMGLVHQGVEQCDVAVHIADATQAMGKGDRFVAEFLKQKEKPVVLLFNKIDLVNKTKLIGYLEQWNDAFQPAAIIPISCKTGDNIDRALSVISELLPEKEWQHEEDVITDKSMRFHAQEWIREKILHYTKEEIPHAVAVQIDTFEEGGGEEPWFIEATIFVERKTQRMILLGAGGQMIKKIRQAAQRNLKKLLGYSGHLELFVKVEKNWRQSKEFIEQLSE